MCMCYIVILFASSAWNINAMDIKTCNLNVTNVIPRCYSGMKHNMRIWPT